MMLRPTHILPALLLLCAMSLCPCSHLRADDDYPYAESMETGAEEQVQYYVQKIERVLPIISKARIGDLDILRRNIQTTTIEWQLYQQTIMPLIAQSENLTTLSAQVQVLLAQAQDSLASATQRAEKVKAHRDAQSYIHAQLSAYLDMQKRADLLSLSPKTAQQLADLKGREQLLMSDIDKQYNIAKEGLQADASLAASMDAIEGDYVRIKQMSAHIQQQEYVSPIDRIKALLPYAAYSAILFMAFSMVQSRIKAAKAVKKQMEQLSGKLDKDGQPIPEI